MKKEALSQFQYPDLILLSFLLFFFCFIGVVIWTMSKKNKEHFQNMSRLPLLNKDEEVKKGDLSE